MLNCVTILFKHEVTISCLKVGYLSLFYSLFIFSCFLLLRLSPVAQADPELPIVKTGLEFLILLSPPPGQGLFIILCHHMKVCVVLRLIPRAPAC